jgi:hypothetical protein
MARLATLTVAALVGLALAGCSGGNFGQAGVSLPSADGVQTVSDAADALDAHRSSATQSARAAIAVTDALGSFVRDISAQQRALSGVRRTSLVARERRILSRSVTLLRLGSGYVTGFCQGSAGYSSRGIPSLDETFGWESGAFSGGSRTADGHGSVTWLANASGAVVQGPIGGLSIGRGGSGATCPMMVPPFVLRGGTSASAFSIPIAMTFRRGTLENLNVFGARFSSGESLYATSETNRRHFAVNGTIAKDRTQLATFRTDASGNGTVTVTSTGAQYVIADWIVTGT